MQRIQIVNDEGFRVFGRNDESTKSWKIRYSVNVLRNKFEDLGNDVFTKLVLKQEKRFFLIVTGFMFSTNKVCSFITLKSLSRSQKSDSVVFNKRINE